MKKSACAARSHLLNLVLGSVATFGLAACGGSGGGSASSATASALPSLVRPTVGVIARAPGASPTTTTPVSGSTTAGNKGPGTNTITPPKPPNTTGTATLDWMPPTENSDGSVLTNLAGYTVYYGKSPSALTQSVKITNPGLTAYTISNLPAGTWYFAVTAYSASGTESSRTGTVSTTI